MSSIDPNDMLAKYGKSFNWAAAFLNKNARAQAQIIYAFCRYIDDIVDENSDAVAARQQLLVIKQAIQQEKSDHIIVSNMISLVKKLGIKKVLVLQLIDGVGWDLEHQLIADEKMLLRYSYGVASTVGLLMCVILQIVDAKALRFAIDLGIAMQLTNIARDVVEDAKRGRVYIPQSWLTSSLTADMLLKSSNKQEEIFSAILRLLNLAEVYYNSAYNGLIYLPWRARISIIIAATLYRAIGRKIMKLDAKIYWQRQRIYTTKLEKIHHSISAIIKLFSNSKYLQRKSVKPHKNALHNSIEDLIQHAI